MKIEHWLEIYIEQGKLELYERIGHREVEELQQALAQWGLKTSESRSTPCG